MAQHTLKRVTESRLGLAASKRPETREASIEQASGDLSREASLPSVSKSSQSVGGAAGQGERAASRAGARSGLGGRGTVSELLGRGGGGDGADRKVFFKEGFIFVKEDRGRAMGSRADDSIYSKDVRCFCRSHSMFYVCVHEYVLHLCTLHTTFLFQITRVTDSRTQDNESD